MELKKEALENGEETGTRPIHSIEQYGIVCTNNNVNCLWLRPLEIYRRSHDDVNVQGKDGSDSEDRIENKARMHNSNDIGGLDSLLRDLWKCCIILSPSSSDGGYHSHNAEGRRENPTNNDESEGFRISRNRNTEMESIYLVMRLKSESTDATHDHATSPSPASSSFLWRQFSALGLSTSDDRRDRAAKSAIITDNDNDRILELAANVLAKRIAQNASSTVIKSRGVISNAANRQDTSKGNSTYRRWISKASSVATSILAYYDLAEEPLSQLQPTLTNDNHYDDAFSEPTNDEPDVADCVCDDAYVQTKSSINEETRLRESDLLWNIDLLCDIWKTLLEYASKVINDTDSHDDTIVTATVTSDKGFNKTGVLLDRRGDGERSFLKFCCKAGEHLLPNEQTLTNPVATVLTNLVDTSLNMVAEVERTAKIVAGELLAMTLISTNQATLSPDGNVLILCPNNTDVDGNIHTSNTFSVHEADLAIFKLTGAIRSLECRIEFLSTRIETTKIQAIRAKRAGNKNAALLHLKQRQMVSNELDQCSGSLYNLETGLHSLERARSNAIVLDAYRMMSMAMKTVTNYSDDVIDTIQDFEGETQKLEDVHIALSSMKLGDADATDNDLERELMSLYDNKDHSNDMNGHHVTATTTITTDELQDTPVDDDPDYSQKSSKEASTREHKISDTPLKQLPVVQ